MLTNPLHDPTWLSSLRLHQLPSYQLLGHLLTDAGPTLTMAWLDNMNQHGPRTGIPGLFTLYDVLHFSFRYESLIEQILAHAFANILIAPEFMMVSPPRRKVPQSKRQRRTRRARVAVFLAFNIMAKAQLPNMVQARQWEYDRHQPRQPFLP